MRIRNLVAFFARSVGTGALARLAGLSLCFVLCKTAALIVAFFVERFVNGVQAGVFLGRTLCAAAAVYVALFLLQSVAAYAYGRAQVRIKTDLQLFLVRTILRQNPAVP